MNNFSIGEAANLAPTGIASFAKVPIANIRNFNADIAIIGAPSDLGIQGKSGTRLGPRGIREQSTRFHYSPGGTYDPEKDICYLSTKIWKIVDLGDIDYIPGDLETTFENIENAVRIIMNHKAFPVILGGDHSISIPVVKGLDNVGDFNVIHIDAHLDWTTNVGNQRFFNGSPCRRMAEIPYVKRISHLGIHGIGSSQKSDFDDARRHGDIIYSPKQIRKIGISNAVSQLPQDLPAYVTIDIDSLDYSIAPGTGSPMTGGLLYDELREILECIAQLMPIIAFDLVEVSPPYDERSGITCYTAARLISDFLGYITKQRELEGIK